MTIETDHLERARALGHEAGRAAASWAFDGNTTGETYRRTLKMLDDGDPEVWDHLPDLPNLSGEWAGDPTPDSLAREILGVAATDHDREVVDELCDAWEAAAQETFTAEIERMARPYAGG
jgi:hypothetical protein